MVSNAINVRSDRVLAVKMYYSGALTAKEVSKLTGISIPAVRSYAANIRIRKAAGFPNQK